jgi:quercetin dioxygenase-like cupin family protein
MHHTTLLIALATLCACTATPRHLTDAGEQPLPVWSAEDLAKPIAVRPLGATPESSRFAIRLREAEKPHIHREHDIVVVLMQGLARVHLGEHIHDMRPGDVMEIPRGVVHWAIPVDGPCVVYAVFTPTYDGSDTHPVDVPAPR